jgi:hypothetical protein
VPDQPADPERRRALAGLPAEESGQYRGAPSLGTVAISTAALGTAALGTAALGTAAISSGAGAGDAARGTWAANDMLLFHVFIAGDAC